MKRFLPLLLLTFCQPKDPIGNILSQHKQKAGKTDQIKNLVTVADCSGPEGEYVTKTESSFTDDYLLFKQDYSYKDNPFYAAIYTKSEGYGLDTALESQGALSEAVIGVLKAHEFHELMLQVDDRYYDMAVGEDTSFFKVDCRQVNAVDHLGYAVKIYFNKASKLMEGFSQVNPYKKGETISVHFEDWEKKDGLTLFDKLTILQGEKLRYSFDYSTIEFNHQDFSRLNLDRAAEN